MVEMTAEEAIEIGRAWPEWQWAPGQIAIMTTPRGQIPVVVCAVEYGSPVFVTHFGGGPVRVTHEFDPDPRDPGFIGHALAQVRAAWGPRVTIYENNGPRLGALTISDGSGAVLFRADGKSRAARLLAARVAAPVGGPHHER